MIKIPKTGRKVGFRQTEISKTVIPKSQTMIGKQIPMTLGPIKASKLHRESGEFGTSVSTPDANIRADEKLAAGKMQTIRASKPSSKYGYYGKGQVF